MKLRSDATSARVVVAAGLALFAWMGPGWLFAQGTAAQAAFEAYLSCERASAAATTADDLLACYAPESPMAQLPPDVLAEIVEAGPVSLTKPVLVEHLATAEGLELRIYGLLDGAPAAERVHMRPEADAWLILEVRTRVYADALASASEDLPLTFQLSIDGEVVFEESNSVLTVSNVGFPVVGLTPLFEDEPAVQLTIDNLRLDTESQRFTRQPSNAIEADPSRVSADVWGRRIPANAEIEGQLSMTEAVNGVASGSIRLWISSATMDDPTEVVLAFQNLPLAD